MRKQVKIIISVIFLLLFLLPTVEKVIHKHHHPGESPCYASGKLFRVQEDHCLICDFTSTDSNSPIPVNYTNLISESYFLFRPFFENVFFQEAVTLLSPRAPPVA